MKALWAKKYSKMKKNSADTVGRVNEKLGGGLEIAVRRSDMDKNYQVNFYLFHSALTYHQPDSTKTTHIHEKYKNKQIKGSCLTASSVYCYLILPMPTKLKQNSNNF